MEISWNLRTSNNCWNFWLMVAFLTGTIDYAVSESSQGCPTWVEDGVEEISQNTRTSKLVTVETSDGCFPNSGNKDLFFSSYGGWVPSHLAKKLTNFPQLTLIPNFRPEPILFEHSMGGCPGCANWGCGWKKFLKIQSYSKTSNLR